MGLPAIAGLGSRPTQRENECPSLDETKSELHHGPLGPTRPCKPTSLGMCQMLGNPGRPALCRESSLRHICPRLAEPSVTTKDLRTRLTRLASCPSNEERTNSIGARPENPSDQNNQQHTTHTAPHPRQVPTAPVSHRLNKGPIYTQQCPRGAHPPGKAEHSTSTAVPVEGKHACSEHQRRSVGTRV